MSATTTDKTQPIPRIKCLFYHEGDSRFIQLWAVFEDEFEEFGVAA